MPSDIPESAMQAARELADRCSFGRSMMATIARAMHEYAEQQLAEEKTVTASYNYTVKILRQRLDEAKAAMLEARSLFSGSTTQRHRFYRAMNVLHNALAKLGEAK